MRAVRRRYESIISNISSSFTDLRLIHYHPTMPWFSPKIDVPWEKLWVSLCVRQMVGWNQASPGSPEKGAHLDVLIRHGSLPLLSSPVHMRSYYLWWRGLTSCLNTTLKHQQHLSKEDLVVLEHLTLLYYFLLRTWYTLKWLVDINRRERSITHPKEQNCEFLLHYQAQKRVLWLSNCCLLLWWDQNPGISL